MATDQVQQVVADLRAIPKEIRSELTPALQDVGEDVASDARSRADWSTRIPGAVKVVVRYGARGRRRPGVLVRVSSRRAPHSRAYEGAGRHGGTFEHPTFGSWEGNKRVTQTRRPFLFPAGQAKGPKAAEAIAQVVEDAARRHGFH